MGSAQESFVLRPVYCVFIATSLALFPTPEAAAQAVFPVANGAVLTSVEGVDAQVLVLNWLEVEGDRDRFTREADAAFRSALPSYGVDVDGGVSHFLFCELKVARAGRTAVVYSWALSLYEFVVGGVHRLEWTTGGIVRVGNDNFSARAAVEECAEGFRREWTRWHPPGKAAAAVR